MQCAAACRVLRAALYLRLPQHSWTRSVVLEQQVAEAGVHIAQLNVPMQARVPPRAVAKAYGFAAAGGRAAKARRGFVRSTSSARGGDASIISRGDRARPADTVLR